MLIWPSVKTAHPAFWTGSALSHSPNRLPLLQLKMAAWTILLIPLNWILGTTLLFVYGITSCLFMRPQRLSALEIAFGALASALMLGLLVVMSEGVEIGRVVAALFNLSIIIVVIAFVNLGRKAQSLSDGGGSWPDRIYKAALVCFAVQVTIVAGIKLFALVAGIQELEFRTLLLGAAGDLPGVLNLYSRITLLSADWIGDLPSPRISGLGIYPTEGALLLAVLGLLGAIHMANRRSWLGLFLVELAIVPMLMLTASRTTAIAYIASLGLLLALAGRRAIGAALLLAPVLLAGTLALATHAADLGTSLFETVSQARAGSSAGRFDNYARAIDIVLDHNVLTGLGVKPRDESVADIPIGSHSTVVSMFTKGGLVALTALGAIYLLLLSKLIASQTALYLRGPGFVARRAVELVYLSRCTLIVLAWWLTEDFDVPAHQAVVAGLALGLFWGLCERVWAERSR